jgi:hypothetical protein
MGRRRVTVSNEAIDLDIAGTKHTRLRIKLEQQRVVLIEALHVAMDAGMRPSEAARRSGYTEAHIRNLRKGRQTDGA